MGYAVIYAAIALVVVAEGQLQQTSNDILSEAGLSYVGGRIVDYWVAIAKRLGLTTTDIENIEARFPPNEQVNQSVQALITWRDNFNYSTNSDKIMHLLSAIKEITAYQALINDITSRFQIGVSTGKTGESSSTGTITVRPTPKTRMISDASVNFIAANIITNWVSIAQELGIIQPDILQAQQKYPGKLFQQAIYILKLWRDSYPQTDTDKIQKLLNTFRNDQDILQYLSNQDGIDITGVQPDTTTTQSTTQPTTVVPTTMSTAPPKIYPGPLKDGSLRKYVSVFGSDWLSLLLKLGMTHEDIAKVPYNNDQNERTFEALKLWRDLPNEDYNTKIAKMLKVLEGIQEPSKPEGAEFNIKEKTTDEVLGPNTRPVDQVVPTVQYKQIRKSDILTDQGLRDLAYNIKSNWETVAQNLGITAEEQQNIKTMYPGDRERQAYEILDLWKRSEPGTVDSKITLLLDSLKDTKPTYIDGYTITKKPLTDLLLFPGFEYILNMLNQDQWIRLVEYLGVPQSQINQLKNDYPQLPRKQAINGLEFWKGSYNAKPEEKVRDVLTALDKLGRPDVKQNIERDYEGVKDLEKLTPSTSDFGSSVGATSPNTEQREHLNRAWLTSIAQNYKNDWKPILTSLGLTLPDIQQIENRYPGNVLEQAISALILWRDRTASEGYQKQYQNLMKAIDDYVKSKSAEPQQPVVHTITNLDYFDSTHMPYLVKNLPDWEIFMRELGFSDADKQAIMRRYVKAEWALRALLQYKLQYPGTSQEKNNKIHTLLQRLKLFDIIRYFEFVQSASRVSDRISDQDIAFIAQNIGNDWEELLLALGLTPQDLVTIKVSFPQSEWTVRALQKFRDEFPGTKEELNFILYKVLQKFFLNTILEYFLWAPSSKDFLDKTVIRYIANNVGAVWETFLINLGVKQADIDDIKLRYPQGEWILQALMKWKNDYPGSYRWKTYRMYEILQRMKLTNILNGIQQDPTKSQKSVNDLFLDPAFQEIAKWLLEQGPHVWKIVMRSLGLPVNDITTLESYYPNQPVTQAARAIELWSNRVGDDNLMKAKWLLYVLKQQNQVKLENYLRDTYGLKDIVAEPGTVKPVTGSQNQEYITGTDIVKSDQLTNAWLERVAALFGTDWDIVAKLLGLTPNQIETIKQMYPSDPLRQATKALTMWRDASTDNQEQQYIILTNAIDKFNRRQIGGQVFDYPDLLATDGIEYFVRVLGSNWEVLMRQLGVQQIDIDYIKSNFPRNDWIRRTLYKWRDEYTGTRQQKNINLYKKLKEMNMMEHINYFKTPTYKPVSELFLIPGLEDIVQRLNQYGPEAWKTLVTLLKLSPDDIRVMELYYRNDLLRQAVHALELWSNRNGVDNNFKAKTLSKALRDNGNPDVADYLDKTYGVKDLTHSQDPNQAVIRPQGLEYIPGTDIQKPNELTDTLLMQLAEIFSKNWEPVARELGLSTSVIDKIKLDFLNDRVKQAYQALLTWKTRSTDSFVNQFNLLRRILYDFHQTRLSVKQTPGQAQTEVPTYRIIDRRDILTDKGLEDLAFNLDKNWIRVATNLGLTDEVIQQIQDVYTNDILKQALEALKIWRRDAPGTNAQRSKILLDALRGLPLSFIKGQETVKKSATDLLTYPGLQTIVERLASDEWKKLVQWLKLPVQDIRNIMDKFPNLPDKQATEALWLWNTKTGGIPDDKVRDLISSLNKIGRNDVGTYITDTYGVKDKSFQNTTPIYTGSNEGLVQPDGIPYEPTTGQPIDTVQPTEPSTGPYNINTPQTQPGDNVNVPQIQPGDNVNLPQVQPSDSGRTLNDIWKEFKIYVNLREFATKLGSDWEQLVRVLGLPESTISRLNSLPGGTLPRSIDALLEWTRMSGKTTEDKLQDLFTKLQLLRRYDLVNYLQNRYNIRLLGSNTKTTDAFTKTNPVINEGGPGQVDPGYQPGPVDLNQPGTVDPNQEGPVDPNQPGSVEPGYQPGPVDPNQPGPVDPGYQPGPVDPNQPGPVDPGYQPGLVDQNQPGPVNPNQPGSVDPGYQPGPVDPNQPGPVDPGYQPGPVDPNKPGSVEPNQPGPVDPNQPGSVDPGYQPGPVDPNQPGPVDPYQPGTVDPGYQPGPVDPNQPGPVDPYQPGPVDPYQPGPVDPGYQPGPVDPDQPGPVDPNEPGPVDPGYQPGPVDPNQPGPVDPNQPEPVDPNQPGPVDPGYQPGPGDPNQPGPVDPFQPGPVDPNQPGPVDPNQPGPVDPGNQPGPVDPDQPGQSKPEILVDPTYQPKPYQPDILVDPTYPPRPIQPEIVVDPTYPTKPDRRGTGQTDSIIPRQPDQTKPGQVDPLPTNKKKLSDDRLRKIAEGIENDWSRILQLLGMDMIDINLIKLQHLDKIDQAFYALKQWQNSNNDYLTMITKLRNVLQTYVKNKGQVTTPSPYTSELFTENELRYIAGQLGNDWETVMRYLNIPHNVIQVSKNEYINNPYQQALRTLKWWIQNNQYTDDYRLNLLQNAMRQANMINFLNSFKARYNVKDKTLTTDNQTPDTGSVGGTDFIPEVGPETTVQPSPIPDNYKPTTQIPLEITPTQPGSTTSQRKPSDRLFTNEGFDYLARLFGSDWRSIVRNLRVPFSVIRHFEQQHPVNYRLRTRNILDWWFKNTQFDTQTRLRLILEALEKTNLKNVIQDLKNTYNIEGLYPTPGTSPGSEGIPTEGTQPGIIIPTEPSPGDIILPGNVFPTEPSTGTDSYIPSGVKQPMQPETGGVTTTATPDLLPTDSGLPDPLVQPEVKTPSDLFRKDGVEYLAEKLLFNWDTVLEYLDVPRTIIDYYKNRHLNNIWLQAREALNWWIANRQLNLNKRLQQLFNALRRASLNDIIPDIENTYGVKDRTLPSETQKPDTGAAGAVDPFPGTDPTPLVDPLRPTKPIIISPQPPSDYLTNLEVQKIAARIKDNWKKVLRELGLSTNDILRIEQENLNQPFTQAIKALEAWGRYPGDRNSKRSRLIDVLQKWNFRDLVSYLSEKKSPLEIFTYPGLQAIAQQLMPDAWEIVAEQLNVTRNQIDKLKLYFPGQPEIQATNALMKWKNKSPKSDYDKYMDLINAIEFVTKNRDIEKYLQQTYDIADLSRKRILPKVTVYTTAGLPTVESIRPMRRYDILTDPVLQNVATRYGNDWEVLLRRLGFKNIKKVQRRYPKDSWAYEALRLWRDSSTNTYEDNIKLLLDTLRQLNKQSIVDYLLPKKTLRDLFTYDGFEELVREINSQQDMELLLQRLNISQPYIEQFKSSYQNQQDAMAIAALIFWTERSTGGPEAKLNSLRNAFRSINRADLVKYLRNNYQLDGITTTETAKINLEEVPFDKAQAFKKHERVIEETGPGSNLPDTKYLLSEPGLLEIAFDIQNNWTAVARQLGLTQTDIDNIITTDQSDKFMQAKRALDLWMSRSTNSLSERSIFLENILADWRRDNVPTPSSGSKDLLSDDGLQYVGDRVGSGWRTLAKNLGLTTTDLTDIERDFTIEARPLAALKRWRDLSRLTSLAKLNRLVTELEILKYTDLVKYLNQRILNEGALSDSMLVGIASQISQNWESFARLLGVPDTLINKWRIDYPGNTNRILRALKSLMWWRDNTGKGDLDTLARLLTILNKANRSDISRNIMTKYFPKGILSDQGLIYIAESFEGDWEPLAKNLGLTSSDIAKIKSDHPFPDDRKQQIIQLLTVWYLHSKETDEDKVITLFKALQNQRQYNFINKLMDKHRTGDTFIRVPHVVDVGQTSFSRYQLESAGKGYNNPVENSDYQHYRRHGWLSDKGLSRIAGQVRSKWRQLAKQLGLNDKQINFIQDKLPYNEDLQALEALRLWREMDTHQSVVGPNTKVGELINALKVLKFKAILRYIYSNFHHQVCISGPNDCKRFGLESGNYQMCNHCNRYVTCVWGANINERECPTNLVWNDVIKTCDYKTSTCNMIHHANSITAMDNTLI